MSDRVSLKDQAYTWLRDAIVTGELQDGSQHSVYRLADQLGISRTPVREAVLQLAEAGLVTVEKNRGVRIHGLTVDDIRDIFELRLLIEVPAAAYAAAHAEDELIDRLRSETSAMATSSAEHDDEGFREHDRALHDLIAGTLENQRLVSTLVGLRDVTRTYGTWTGHGTRPLAEIVAEHDAIVRALVARDPKAASEAMHHHLVRTGTLLMEEVASRTDADIDREWWRRL